MTRRIFAALLAMASVATALLCVSPPAAMAQPDNGSNCTVAAGGSLFGGSQGVVVNGHCVPQSSDSGGVKQKIVSCGKHVPGGVWNTAECGTNVLECFEVKPGQGNVQTNAFATLTLVNDRWTNPQVWCPGDPQAAVTMADIREQAFRLLPRLSVASAWKRTALVNAQVVLWVPTDANRNLPAVDIVGQQVALRIGLTSVRWDFGDGTSDTTSNPGKAYDEARDPCRTAQCPHYYGHTYRHTGKVTISATTSWHVQYRIGDGDWNDLAGPALAAPTSRHTMQILQARGVLVPNPGQH